MTSSWRPDAPAAPAVPPTLPSRGLLLAGLLASVGVFAAGLASLALLVPKGGPAHPDEWDPRVLGLVEFVERARGHDFAEPVFVDFLTPEQYSEQTREDDEDLTEDERAGFERGGGFFRAMGLAEGEVDLLEARNDVADSGTLAYYSPEDERVTVRGTELTPELEVTLVHELTHVLQDQVFDVRRIEHEAGEAASDAVRGLLEGDAGRIEEQYVDQELSAAEREAYEESSAAGAEEGEEALADAPGAFVALFAAPYVLGQPLIETLRTNRRIDKALSDDLPKSDEALWYAATYFAQDAPEEVDAPDAPDGATHPESGTFGPIVWYLVLAAAIDPVEAMTVVDGWGADAYTVASAQPTGGDGSGGRRVCVDAVIAGESPADAEAFADALIGWAGTRPASADAEVSRDGDEVALHACDPGPEAERPDGAPEPAGDVLSVPVIRAYAYLVARRDIGPDVARCAADAAVARFDAAQLIDPDARIFSDGSFLDALQDEAAGC